MKINNIEELKQRIGKIVVFSQYDENYNYSTSTIKILTKIEPKPTWILSIELARKNEFYGHNIWGKYATTLKFFPFQPNSNNESYSNTYQYARDATEEEIKTFRNFWRLRKFSTITNKIPYVDLF